MSAVLTDHLITFMIAAPFLGILVLVFVRGEEWVRRFALGSTLVTLGLSLALWTAFDSTQHEMQFVERSEWMPTFNIHYAVGVDGISMLLVMLTTLLSPICILASWFRFIRGFPTLTQKPPLPAA